MERYGRRKVLYFPSTKRIWVFHLLHHFFYARPLFIFILFRFRPPISLSLFFCDKEKEEDTLVSRRRKARVYGKMRGAEQIFVCPLWRQKKRPSRCRRPVRLFRHMIDGDVTTGRNE